MIINKPYVKGERGRKYTGKDALFGGMQPGRSPRERGLGDDGFKKRLDWRKKKCGMGGRLRPGERTGKKRETRSKAGKGRRPAWGPSRGGTAGVLGGREKKTQCGVPHPKPAGKGRAARNSEAGKNEGSGIESFKNRSVIGNSECCSIRRGKST